MRRSTNRPPRRKRTHVQTRGGRKREGGGNYIPNVAIGVHNRALIGIDKVCCKSQKGKAPIRFITDLVPLPISSVDAYAFGSNNANGVWLIRIA